MIFGIKTLTPLEGYNRWAASYHDEDNPIKKMSDEFILNAIPDLKGRSFLDAGCGTGRLCMAAAKASYVKGLDLSPAMIEQARKNCPWGSFECVDLSKTSIDDFDVIVCGLVLGHIEHLEPVLSKLAEKTRGVLIITDFHPYQTMMKAKRTFKVSGKTFEVKHYLHKLDEYFQILKNSGLTITQFKEPLFEGKPVIFGISGIRS